MFWTQQNSRAGKVVAKIWTASFRIRS